MNSTRRSFLKTLGLGIVSVPSLSILKTGQQVKDPDVSKIKPGPQSDGFNQLNAYQGHWHNIQGPYGDAIYGTPRTSN